MEIGFWGYWAKVLRVACKPAIDLAQAIIFAAIIVVGFLAYELPGLKMILEWLGWSEALSGWQVAAFILSAIVVVRLAFAPYWIYKEQESQIAALRSERARLSESGPFPFRDSQYKNSTSWRINVHNGGPATADNVRVKLCSITPRPKSWHPDCPYNVLAVGSAPDAGGSLINPNDSENYELVRGWKTESGELFFTNLDTRAGRPIQIERGERWTLSYELNATNAVHPLKFTMGVFIEGDDVKVVRG
ncbi:MAG TPA: hypothetical protein VGU20_21130 [Stellaceae bacterium]|nr:hypothetical protein [Stellaceae bacterium]